MHMILWATYKLQYQRSDKYNLNQNIRAVNISMIRFDQLFYVLLAAPVCPDHLLTLQAGVSVYTRYGLCWDTMRLTYLGNDMYKV